MARVPAAHLRRGHAPPRASPSLELRYFAGLALRHAGRTADARQMFELATRYDWEMRALARLAEMRMVEKDWHHALLADIREGSIGLSALYANMLTGLANADEMPHFFDFARRLRSEYQLPMTARSYYNCVAGNYSLCRMRNTRPRCRFAAVVVVASIRRDIIRCPCNHTFAPVLRKKGKVPHIYSAVKTEVPD